MIGSTHYLDEIIASGIAPGINTRAKDPGCPQMAVPRALREMEINLGGHSDRIKAATQYSTKQLKAIWWDGKKKRKR